MVGEQAVNEVTCEDVVMSLGRMFENDEELMVERTYFYSKTNYTRIRGTLAMGVSYRGNGGEWTNYTVKVYCRKDDDGKIRCRLSMKKTYAQFLRAERLVNDFNLWLASTPSYRMAPKEMLLFVGEDVTNNDRWSILGDWLEEHGYQELADHAHKWY